MKDRIFRNWKTSIFGLALIIFAGALTWTGRTSGEFFLLIIPIAAAWLYFKDPARSKDIYNGKAR